MNEELRRQIGRRLRVARISAGLSQKDMAEQLRLKSRQTISAWERGEATPQVDQWYQLGVLLGTSLDYMVYGIRTVPVSRTDLMDSIFGSLGVEPVGEGFRPPVDA